MFRVNAVLFGQHVFIFSVSDRKDETGVYLLHQVLEQRLLFLNYFILKHS